MINNNKRVPAPFDYASSSVNYPAGPEEWANFPRVTPPSLGELADGETPNTDIPANVTNWFRQIESRARLVQMHEAMQRWQAFTFAGSLAGNAFCLASMLPSAPDGVFRADRWIAVGANIATAFDAFIAGGNATKFVPYSTTATTLTSPLGMISGARGQLAAWFTASTKLVNKLSENESVAWDETVTPIAALNLSLAYHYNSDSFGQRFFAVGASKIAFSGSVAGSYTNVFTGSFASGVEFADDGDTKVVLIVDTGVGWHVLSSTNAGATWADVFTLPASPDGLCYSPANGVFVLSVSGGVVYTSSDGVTWNATGLIPLQSGYAGRGTLAACGFAIAKLYMRPLGGIRYENGVYYSFDGGVNWTKWTFAEPSAASIPLLQIISANGRFYAIDKNTIYVSGCLEYEERVG